MKNSDKTNATIKNCEDCGGTGEHFNVYWTGNTCPVCEGSGLAFYLDGFPYALITENVYRDTRGRFASVRKALKTG